MQHVLIVANKALADPAVRAWVCEVDRESSIAWRVALPVRVPSAADFAGGLPTIIPTALLQPGPYLDDAWNRLLAFADDLRLHGVTVAGNVWDCDPLEGVHRAMACGPVDLLALAAPANPFARALRLDLARRLRRRFDVPIVEIGDRAPTPR